jgi:hypothetical protein
MHLSFRQRATSDSLRAAASAQTQTYAARHAQIDVSVVRLLSDELPSANTLASSTKMYIKFFHLHPMAANVSFQVSTQHA